MNKTVKDPSDLSQPIAPSFAKEKLTDFGIPEVAQQAHIVRPIAQSSRTGEEAGNLTLVLYKALQLALKVLTNPQMNDNDDVSEAVIYIHKKIEELEPELQKATSSQQVFPKDKLLLIQARDLLYEQGYIFAASYLKQITREDRVAYLTSAKEIKPSSSYSMMQQQMSKRTPHDERRGSWPEPATSKPKKSMPLPSFSEHFKLYCERADGRAPTIAQSRIRALPPDKQWERAKKLLAQEQKRLEEDKAEFEKQKGTMRRKSL